MTRPTQAVINLRALRHNLRKVRERIPHVNVMAIIKANGYGHGIVRVARALDEADAYGVASADEAVALRAAGVTRRITLLEGFFEAAELDAVCRYGLTPVIHHVEQLQILERAALNTPVSVWLKIDSGMHRLGVAPAAAREAWRRLTACRHVQKPIGLMTHLANADDREDSATRHQLECFNQAIAGLEGERSIANSAGLLGWTETHAEWVRPGIMLYGVTPFNTGNGGELGLRPVMTLSSRLIAVNRFKKGDAIGYGGAYVCPEDMPVGVVAVGYGDGYPRHAVTGTPVLVNGQRADLIGRVSMDMIFVDLRTQPAAAIGDPVVLWGEGLPVEEVARHAATIPYQLLCNVSQRVVVVERQ